MGRGCVNSTRNWFSDLVEGQRLEFLTPESPPSQLLSRTALTDAVVPCALSTSPCLRLFSFFFSGLLISSVHKYIEYENRILLLLKLIPAFEFYYFVLHTSWSQASILGIDQTQKKLASWALLHFWYLKLVLTWKKESVLAFACLSFLF